MIEKRKIFRITPSSIEETYDYISREEIVEVIFNGDVLIRHSISPNELVEWTLGYLYSNSMITDVKAVVIEERDDKVYVEGQINPSGGLYWTQVSGCGASLENLCLNNIGNLKENNFSVEIHKIFEAFEKFNQMSENFKKSGSLHSAGLFDGDKIVYFSEDIARHNAVDKVIGKALLASDNLEKFALLTSGRISSEIVRKCGVSKIPIIISHSAPTTFAIDLANLVGISLVGFLRGKRFNVYCNSWRLTD